MTARPLWFWLAFPAVTVSLGWGLRGSIGGGPLGAMIPGAMVGLALCLLLGRERDAGLVAAFGAVGSGFGGQETYGQTVGLILRPETFWWAALGFAIKGAGWGLLGGAFLGVALDRRRFTARQLGIGFALMVAGTWLGWAVVNHPKLVYFSNRVDRPREELWAGLWLGGLLLLGWLRARVPAWFALHGTVGGGVGFAFGASLQPWGKAVWPLMPLGWWKGMELTFGALLGVSLGWCAWRFREEQAGEGKDAATGSGALAGIGLAAIAIALVAAGEAMPGRFGYTIAGAVLCALVLFSDSLAWQTAVTATVAAFAWDDAHNQKVLAAPLAEMLAAAAAVATALYVARGPRTKAMYLFLAWAGVAAAFRYALPPVRSTREPYTMLAVFVAQAVLLTKMVSVTIFHRRSSRTTSSE